MANREINGSWLLADGGWRCLSCCKRSAVQYGPAHGDRAKLNRAHTSPTIPLFLFLCTLFGDWGFEVSPKYNEMSNLLNLAIVGREYIGNRHYPGLDVHTLQLCARGMLSLPHGSVCGHVQFHLVKSPEHDWEDAINWCDCSNAQPLVLSAMHLRLGPDYCSYTTAALY